MSKMRLCKYCIEAMRSHGKKVYVGEMIEVEENQQCDFCEEKDDELYECKVADGTKIK